MLHSVKLEPTVHAEATLVLSDIILTEDNSPSNISRAAVGEPLRPIRIIICKDKIYSIDACIHESRVFMEIMDEWGRVKATSNVLGGARYPINTGEAKECRFKVC